MKRKLGWAREQERKKINHANIKKVRMQMRKEPSDKKAAKC